MNKDVRYLARWVLDVATPGGDHAVREVATRLLKESRRSPRKDLGLGRKKPTSAELNQRTRDLRAELVMLAGPYCERCEWPLPAALGHMHHLRGGSGKRRQEQNINNVAWICGGCHDALHRDRQANQDFAARIASKRKAGTP